LTEKTEHSSLFHGFHLKKS